MSDARPVGMPPFWRGTGQVPSNVTQRVEGVLSRIERGHPPGHGAALALWLALLVGSVVACSGPSRYEPTTTKVGGGTVFVIYPSPPCPKNADCAAGVVIDKQLYGLGAEDSPKAQYRTGPLFAVGSNQEAHLIASLTTSTYRVLALRTGSQWGLAFSPGRPTGESFQRQICQVLENLPRNSYCVTKLGFATTEPFDPSKVAAPPGNGHGPAGTCDGTETAPLCGAGAVVGKYYPYTWAPDCSERAFLNGRLWQGTLRPTQQQPPYRGWMTLTGPDTARWTGTNGTDGLTPATGPAPACPPPST